MEAGTLNRLVSGHGTPSDFQRILLAAQESPQRLLDNVRESQGHVEYALPGHFSTVTVRALKSRTTIASEAY